MNSGLTFWDHISLGLALLYVLVFIALRLKHAFTASSSGCSGCSYSSDACSAPLTKTCLERKQEAQSFAIDSIQKNVI